MPGQERTEAATPRRREQARRRGHVARSVELTSAMVLIAAFTGLRMGGGYVYESLSRLMVDAIGRSATIGSSAGEVSSYLARVSLSMLLPMAPVALAAAAMGFLMSSAQVGFVLSPQALAPSLAKLNPVSGLSCLVSSRSLVELIKSIAKVAIVGYVGYRSVAGEDQNLFRIADMDVVSMLIYVGGLTFNIGIKAGLVLIVLGVADYAYQRFEYEKSIRMTKEELRQEAKEYDGDPLVRSRIRRSSARCRWPA